MRSYFMTAMRTRTATTMSGQALWATTMMHRARATIATVGTAMRSYFMTAMRTGATATMCSH